MSQTVINATEKDLNKLYNGSAYTIIGVGGDINEWIEGYNQLLKENGIGTPAQWYKFSGRQVNQHYKFNFFNDDVTFLAFSLKGLNINKLAIFKIKMGDRWFDDVIDNLINRDEYDYDEVEEA